MKFAVSVDLSTLNCTYEVFEKTLHSIGPYMRINDSFWLVECSDFPNKLSKDMFYTFFEKLTNENSNILINAIENNYYWNLDEKFSCFLND